MAEMAEPQLLPVVCRQMIVGTATEVGKPGKDRVGHAYA
jgi:hypothetical protein